MDICRIPGILLVYHHPLEANAPTILEHVNAFEKYSSWPVWSINCGLGFPRKLRTMSFDVIVLHYSLFGSYPFSLTQKFTSYIKSTSSFKTAFFQDEHQNCSERLATIIDLGVDSIYSLLEPCYHEFYLKNTQCKSIHHTLTGYVDDALIDMSSMLTTEDAQRTIDIGYRARPLPLWMGRGAQEKTEIADGFLSRLLSEDLFTDIKTAESERIYGRKWPEFVANCRGMLGVEAGVSVFDLDGEAQKAYKDYLISNDLASRERLLKTISSLEGNIYYRTISPRVFECAAFRTCMILFEGDYQGILKPMEHYIPLKKDFSNFDSVIKIFRDSKERHRLTDNAYNDLIASGRYSYRSFIEGFDRNLIEFGLQASAGKHELQWVDTMLNEDLTLRRTALQASYYTRKKLASLFPADTAIGETLRRAKKKLSDWSTSR